MRLVSQSQKILVKASKLIRRIEQHYNLDLSMSESNQYKRPLTYGKQKGMKEPDLKLLLN